MPSLWPLNLTENDRNLTTELARRRAQLGLKHTYASTIRTALAFALEATDAELLAADARFHRPREVESS